jgi:hypothetical protein
MEIDELPENDERLLKKAEIKPDEMGRRLRRSLARPTLQADESSGGLGPASSI